MVIDYANYPPGWFQLRRLKTEQVGNICQHCGVRGDSKRPNGRKVCLQLAHIHGVPLSAAVSTADVLLLCARCHLAYDRQLHHYSRKFKYDL